MASLFSSLMACCIARDEGDPRDMRGVQIGDCKVHDPEIDEKTKYFLRGEPPEVKAPLDPDFSPFLLGKKRYNKYMIESVPNAEKLYFAIVREGGCGRDELRVFPEGKKEGFQASVFLAGEMIRNMLWQRGGHKLLLFGPRKICNEIKAAYSPRGKFGFEALTMPKVCNRDWSIEIVSTVEELPAAEDRVSVHFGKEAQGCRIAFDMSKTDVRTVAVKDGQVLTSTFKVREWDVTNPDPQFHYDTIVKTMQETASHVSDPIVAIGGSTTGTVSADGEVMWCDCFPSVQPELHQKVVAPIFKDIAKEFGGVPIKVINGGDATAIVGAQMIGKSCFGICLGSSEGTGYVNENNQLTDWIHENAYCPFDLNSKATGNPWSPHRGDASMYLGQRAFTRLAAKGGVDLPPEMMPEHESMNATNNIPHAECLKKVQAAMRNPSTEHEARKIYETVGVYLGYAVAQYREQLPFQNVMVSGRACSGPGEEIIIKKAKSVLEEEFPGYGLIEFHTTTEHMERLAQCVAALPQV